MPVSLRLTLLRWTLWKTNTHALRERNYEPSQQQCDSEAERQKNMKRATCEALMLIIACQRKYPKVETYSISSQEWPFELHALKSNAYMVVFSIVISEFKYDFTEWLRRFYFYHINVFSVWKGMILIYRCLFRQTVINTKYFFIRSWDWSPLSSLKLRR